MKFIFYKHSFLATMMSLLGAGGALVGVMLLLSLIAEIGSMTAADIIGILITVALFTAGGFWLSCKADDVAERKAIKLRQKEMSSDKK